MSGEGSKNALIFRINEDGRGPEVIKQVFLERGWIEFDEDDHAEHEFNLWWRTSRFRTSDHEGLNPWQQLNHYPKSSAITKKDALTRNMKRMKGVHGAAAFNFCPNGFNLPNDYTKFVAEYSRLRDKNPDKVQYWICKPADMSRGRGIFLFKDINELNYDCNAVVQTYISNPLLIGGYKFDLRIYVVVPSFHPLNIYIFQEGLVRFSTEKFDLSSLKNVFSHLTNTSINKYSPSYTVEKEAVGPGCKWTLTQLRHYFRQSNVDDSQLFIKIQYIIMLTLLVQAQQVPKQMNCFELYGFDIMVDENMKAWLLEVNFSPALATESQTDVFVKKPLINDLIELLGFTEQDKERGGPDFKPKTKQQDMYTSYVPYAGGRRSGMGNMAGNRRNSNPSLRKKNSQSRFQALSSNGQNGSTSNLSLNTPRSTTTTEAEETPIESTPKPPSSPGQKVVPIMPGCGLPSVQQPGRIGMKNAHQHAEPDSGHSSNPGSESEGEEKVDSAVAKGRSKTAAINTPRTAFASENNSNRGYQSSRHIRSFNRITSRNPTQVAATQSSKFSLASDSGLSSTSGSNSSDYAEQSSRQGLNSQDRQELDINTSLKKKRDSTQSLESSGKDQNSDSHKRTGKQSHFSNRSSENKFTQLRSNTSGYRQKPVSFLTYKSQMNARASPQRNVSSQGLAEVRHATQPSGRASRRQQQQSYDKPWRKSRPQKESGPVTKPGTPKPSPLHPKSRVGDFFLAFPFNQVTKQCAQNGLDARVVIREAQKMLKDRLAASVVERHGGGGGYSRQDAYVDDNNSSGLALFKGSSSARSSQRSLPITLASEKTMLSSATDPGGAAAVMAGPATSARSRRPPPLHVVNAKQEYSELWAPIVLETQQEHTANF